MILLIKSRLLSNINRSKKNDKTYYVKQIQAVCVTQMIEHSLLCGLIPSLDVRDRALSRDERDLHSGRYVDPTQLFLSRKGKTCDPMCRHINKIEMYNSSLLRDNYMI